MKPLPIVLLSTLAALSLAGVVVPPQATTTTTGANVAAGSAPAPAQATVVPPITFDGTTPLVLERRNTAGNPYALIALKNDGPAPQTFELSAVILDNNDQPVSVAVDQHTRVIPSGGPFFVWTTLRMTGVGAGRDRRLPLRGYLVLKTVRDKAPPPPGARELRVALPNPSAEADDLVVRWSLWPAFVTVLLGYLLAGPTKLFDRIGSASWSDSWGSTVTVGASLLTAFLGLTVFPEQTRYLPRASYTVLSVVFAGLVALAPVLYGLFRTPVSTSTPMVQYQGYVFGFCISAVFTLWGAAGQLWTLDYAIRELEASRAFSPLLSRTILTLARGLLVVLPVYGVVAVRQIIVRASAPAGSSGTAGRSTATASDWSLL